MTEYKGTIYITHFELLDDFKIKVFLDLNKSSKSFINNLTNINDLTLVLKTFPKNFYRYYKQNYSTQIKYNDFKYISEVYALCSIIKNNDDFVLKSITIKDNFNFDNNNVNNNDNSPGNINIDYIYLNRYTYRKETIKQNIMKIFNI